MEIAHGELNHIEISQDINLEDTLSSQNIESSQVFDIASSPPQSSTVDYSLGPLQQLTQVTRANESVYVYPNDKLLQKLFENWWIQTSWYNNNKLKPENERFTILWNSKKKSLNIWNNVQHAADCQSGAPKVVCSYCNKILQHPSVGIGNSGIRRHLQSSECRKSSSDVERDQLSILDGFRKQKKKQQQDIIYNSAITTEREDFQEHFEKAIIALNLPFIASENIHLLRALRCLDSKIELPSSSTIKNHLKIRCLQIQQDIQAKLPKNKRKVSLAIDGWTAPENRQEFLSILVFWIDERWTYHEQLLDFAPVYGRHDAKNFAEIIDRVIDSYQLTNRILTITADNAATNSKTKTELIKLINERNEQLGIQTNHNQEIQLVPCLSHVIQLALGVLLKTMHIRTPKRDLQLSWDHEYERDEFEKQKKDLERAHGIPLVLFKCRKIALWVNASQKRLEEFAKLQKESNSIEVDYFREKPNLPKTVVKLFQDGETRWDSTYYMLVRFYRLEEPIKKMIEQRNNNFPVWLSLTNKEWQSIKYLIDLASPFAMFTQSIGSTRDPQIHHVLAVYNKLFDHLESLQRRLQRKREPFKKYMLLALEASQNKLREYYSKTQGALGYLYGVCTLLSPGYKLRFFQTKDWEGEDEAGKPWADVYWDEFTRIYQKDYRDAGSTLGPTNNAGQTLSQRLDPIAQLIECGQNKANRDTGKKDELRLWKNEARKIPDPEGGGVSALDLWRQKEKRYPRIASMARDYLAIPAAGVGVERSFSIARSLWDYNQHYTPDTFRAIMLARYYDKEELDTLKRLLLEQPGFSTITEVNENLEAVQSLHHTGIHHISDDEDSDSDSDLDFTESGTLELESSNQPASQLPVINRFKRTHTQRESTEDSQYSLRHRSLAHGSYKE